MRSNEHVLYCSETEIVGLSSITTLSFRISKRVILVIKFLKSSAVLAILAGVCFIGK